MEIRAVKTIEQMAVATMGGVDWVLVASESALAGILSLLTSIAGPPERLKAKNKKQGAIAPLFFII